MTNYGARTILARPRKAGQGEASELRLLIALETISTNGHGERRATLQLVAELAGLPYSTARLARDRLVAAGEIKHQRGYQGHAGTWHFTYPVDSAHPAGRYQEPIAPTQQGAIGNRDSIAPTQEGDIVRAIAPATPVDSANPRVAHELVRDIDNGSVGEQADRARDDDDRPDWRRGPGRAISPTRVYAPGQGPGRDMRPTPTPPAWTSPRKPPPPEIAEQGAKLARELLAKRPGRDTAPRHPRSDDERRAHALRQVERARDERERAAPPKREDDPVTEPADDEPGLPPTVYQRPEPFTPPERDDGDERDDFGEDERDEFGDDESPPDEMPF